jgi:parvulin-like peptidyl-prolyl isomerase
MRPLKTAPDDVRRKKDHASREDSSCRTQQAREKVEGMFSTPSERKRQTFPWRYIVYFVLLGYLYLDLKVVGGPLRHYYNDRLSPSARLTGSSEKAVAQANGRVISRRELDRAVDVHLFSRGESLSELSPLALEQVQRTVLEELITQIVVPMYVKLKPEPVAPEAAESALRRFRSQFTREEQFQSRLAAQGLTVENLLDQFREEALVTAYLEAKIAPTIKVTDQEIADFYQSNPDVGATPEVLRVRHLFLSGHDKDAGDRTKEINRLSTQITNGATIATLAAKHSEDPNSSKKEGDLGLVTASRVPNDFFEAISPLAVAKPSKPFPTKLGWHIAEITERHPASRSPLAIVAPEIRAHLESERRHQAMLLLLGDLKARAKTLYFLENLN